MLRLKRRRTSERGCPFERAAERGQWLGGAKPARDSVARFRSHLLGHSSEDECKCVHSAWFPLQTSHDGESPRESPVIKCEQL